MTPDYVRVKPAWTVAQALEHVRVFGSDSETLNVIYVTDPRGVLIDDLRIRQFLTGDPETRVADLMDEEFVALNVLDDESTAVDVFRKHDRTALPVVDGAGVLVGIVTVDDVLDVQEREATEDIQMLGGVQALAEPYLDVPIITMVRKRAVWLVILLFGGMLTAEAMTYYEDELAQAVVLAIFLPLIIASGGNSGSQAATLITRALALGEVRLHDWWRVMRRELVSGVLLGIILGSLGFARIALWAIAFGLRAVLAAGRPHGRCVAVRRGGVGVALGLVAAAHPQALGRRPGHLLGAVHRHAGGRHRHHHLLHHRHGVPERHAAVATPPGPAPQRQGRCSGARHQARDLWWTKGPLPLERPRSRRPRRIAHAPVHHPRPLACARWSGFRAAPRRAGHRPQPCARRPLRDHDDGRPRCRCDQGRVAGR